jgi:hypothetical protein
VKGKAAEAPSWIDGTFLAKAYPRASVRQEHSALELMDDNLRGSDPEAVRNRHQMDAFAPTSGTNPITPIIGIM